MARTALVTGASSGIGAATARRLATDGFEVVVIGRRGIRCEQLADEIGGRALRVDITDERSVEALAEAVPSLDVLVNNAGGAIGTESVESADPADWRKMYEVNVLGTLRVVQAMLPALRSEGGGTVVTVTSTAAETAYEGGGGYCAAKFGERALVDTLRLELSGCPVRVVDIAPGMVRTEDFALNRYRGDQAAADRVYEGVDGPLTAEDVAECIAFACGLPQHVNVDRLVVRPLAQAAAHKVHRGPLISR